MHLLQISILEAQFTKTINYSRKYTQEKKTKNYRTGLGCVTSWQGACVGDVLHLYISVGLDCSLFPEKLPRT